MGHSPIGEIEEFVASQLPANREAHFQHYPPSRPKIIHDAVWGTFRILPLEAAVLDTPLVQRLRAVHQTGFAYLVYPSATHTRLEHSLGVVRQADRIYQTLAETEENRHLLGDEIRRTIRLAALLHDIGHGPFSHTSEEFYENDPLIGNLRSHFGADESAKASELLAAAVLSTNAFLNFLNDASNHFRHVVDGSSLAGMILGRADPQKVFAAEIVHGPLDADKLDYTARDGHFAGLPLGVDLDRLWHSLVVRDVEGRVEQRLAVTIAGSVPAEQIIFNKMVLYSTIYHHHKVRSCDVMMKAFLHRVSELGCTLGDEPLKQPIDYLRFSDHSLLHAGLQSGDPRLKELAERFVHRRLYKRAFVIANFTLDSKDSERAARAQLTMLSRKLPTTFDNLRKLAGSIWEDAGKPCDEWDVWVDLPKPPNVIDAKRIPVVSPANTMLSIRDLIPFDEWAKQYEDHKWRGHVFCPAEEDVRTKISNASKAVLEREFPGIKFNTLATALAIRN